MQGTVSGEGKPRVLIVEDELIIAMELRLHLERLGYEVVDIVVSGELAVLSAERLRPALIMMDVNLRGGIDGIEASARIRRFSDVPIVFLTAYTDDVTLRRALATGPSAYLSKPFGESDLRLALEVALHRHAAERARSEAEERRHAADRMLASVLEAMPDGVLAIDAEGRVVLFNLAAEGLFGWERAEVIGQPLHLLLPADRAAVHDVHVAAFRESPDLLRPMSTRRPVRGRRRDGREFAADVTLSKVALGGQLLMCAVVRDSSERDRLNAELMQAQKLDAIGRLSGSIAHDFNNLLVVVQSAAGVLARGPIDDTTRVELAADIQTASNRGVALIQRLLAFARAESEAEAVSELGAVVRAFAPLLERLLSSDVHFRVSVPPGARYVRCDALSIDQVLLNLVTNARDALRGAGTIVVEVADGPQDGEVTLAVHDDGVGMSDEVRARIFEPFFTTKAAGEGTGLGLSTVARLVYRGGGRVAVRSALGEGSTVSVTLPRAAGPAPHAVRSSVLWVSNCPVTAERTAQVLEACGATVSRAPDTAGALALAADSDRPLLGALVDAGHPGALDAVRLLRRVREDLTVALVGGSGAPGIASLRAPLGEDDARAWLSSLRGT